MQKLIKGLHHFRNCIFPPQQAFFEKLALGQYPEALFITCSDSRVNPNLITQTQPGDLFVVRNAGNIVPPHGATAGGESAAIEYAVRALQARDIIVCGHTQCGAIQALLDPPRVKGLPLVANWLSHAEATRRIVARNYPHMTGAALLNVAVQENVLVQLEHLRTQPAVAEALAEKRLRLHGWVYKIETGEVRVFDPESQQFVPLPEALEEAV